jgi:hypothetical protein
MTARATYPSMASVADDGLVLAGLTEEIREALTEIDLLRRENERLLVEVEFWAIT